MTVGKAIFYLLDNSTDLTAIVGTRIYPEVAQQDAPLPYVVYNISNNEPSDTKREPSKLDTANIEVNCYSTSYTEVIDMAVAVRAALDRVTGTYSGVNVQSIAYMNEVIDFDEGQRAYNVSSDYDVRISRTDFEIAQGTPITGVDLGDLADVNTTGVTNGQVIAYDAATSVWLPATDGGAQQLNDLSDVIISQPDSGEFFRYSGGEWVNDSAAKGDVGLGNVDNTSDANKPISTATQTALDLKADITSVPTELDDLNDVQIIGTPTLGQALVYGAGKWLPGAAGATELGDLDDVNTTGAGFGSLLTFNGSSWDISASELPTDNIYFHQRYETESEALRTGATATTELYFTCTADGNGLAESASTDTPTAGNVINRKIYYSEAGFADPDTGTWIEFTPAPADDATFATVKAALLEYLKARTGGTVPISLKQTWVENTPSTYLLDQAYGSGAAAAYSTRQLRNAQTDCMVILRASDSTTTTIGFDGSGNIDEAAITTFCTGTTCTVSEWIDQSGNGNNATQATAGNQPVIYTGGALVKENGRLALDFDGVSDNMTSVSTYTPTTSMAQVIIVKGLSSSADQIIGDNSDRKAGMALRIQNGSFNYFNGFTTGNNQISITANDNQNLHFYGRDTSSNFYARLNGSETSSVITAINTAAQNIYLGARHDGSLDLDGAMQEYILYLTSKSADKTSIEENVGDYFTQNTPLLDTYSGAAAAYSLRLLDSTYTGSAIRVRRSSDNTEQDINFNVFGELDTVSLTAFAGTGDAFVKFFYDQSGNSNDATQTATTKQPQIVLSGAVIVDNGKPAMLFDGSADGFTMSGVGGTGSKFGFITHSVDSSDTAWSLFSDTATSSVIPLGQSGSGSAGVFGYTMNNIYSGGALISPNTRGDIYNAYTSAGQSLTALDFSGDAVGVLFLRNNFIMQGKAQEVIIYASDESANRAGIETNINTFYSIY